MEDTKKTRPSKWTWSNHMGTREIEAACTGPAQACIRSFGHILWLSVWIFMGFLSVGTRGSLFLVHSLGLFPLVCLVQLERVGYVMLYPCPSEPWLVSNERQKGIGFRWEWRWEELERVEIMETGVKIHYVREKKLFPIKGKRNMEQKQGSIAGCFLLTFAFSSRAVQIPWAFGLL